MITSIDWIKTVYTEEEAIAFITEELKNLNNFQVWLEGKPMMEPICYARNAENCSLTSYFRWKLGDRFQFHVTSDRFEVLTRTADIDIPMTELAYRFVRAVDDRRSFNDIVRVGNALIALKRARGDFGGNAA